MPTTPAVTFPPSAPSPRAARGVGPVAWLAGAALAVAASVAAVVVAVLFAAVMVVVTLLVLLLALLAFAAAKTRRRAGRRPVVMTARWTGYGWDA